MAKMERALEYTQLPEEGDLVNTSHTDKSAIGSILFDGVSFRYWNEGPTILKNANFVISPGEKVS